MNRLRMAILLAALFVANGLAVPGPVAAADAPNSCAGATSNSSQSAWIYETISPSGDVDWYRFSNNASRYVLITLGKLPADFDLYLYASGDCTNAIASSHRSNREFDQIYRSLGLGTYYVRVVGYRGASSSATYGLRWRPLPGTVHVLNYTSSVDGAGYLHFPGEILNNTPDARRWIQIDATLYDSADRVIGSGVGYPDRAIVPARGRSPFEIVARRPSGYHHARLSIFRSSVTTASAGSLGVTPAAPYADATRWHFPGSVTNNGSSTTRANQVLVTLYDAYGAPRAVTSAWTSPRSIVAGGTASFDAHVGSSTSWNRADYRAQGTRLACTAGHSEAGVSGYVDYRGAIPNAGPRVALTFDMGGRMVPALKIVKLLIANRVCATIFPTGRQARDSAEGPQVMALIKAHPELFELGNHTMHHCDLVVGGGGSPSYTDVNYCNTAKPDPSAAFIQKELLDAEAILEAATGFNVKPYWRAPYGSRDSSVLSAAAEVGYDHHFGWDVDTIDWKPISDGGPTARSMTIKVVDNAKSGSVVLMHLGGFETLDALQAMIDGLRSRGFVLTTLSDMLN